MEVTTQHTVAGNLATLPTELLVDIFQSYYSDNDVRLQAQAALARVCRRLNVVVTPMLYANSYFSDLPTNILVKIFEQVAWENKTTQRNLSTLALVCRRFQHAVTPLLYTTLESCCERRIRLYEEVISLHPELPSYLTRFACDAERQHTKRHGRVQKGLLGSANAYTSASASYEGALERAADLGIPEEKLRAISSKPSYPLGVLFVMLKCPNIEEIEYLGDYEYLLYWPLKWAVENINVGRVHHFKNLRSLTYRVDVQCTFPFNDLSVPLNRQTIPHNSLSIPLSNISVLFQLPSLRTLRLKDSIINATALPDWEADRTEWNVGARASSPIQELILEQCEIDYRWVSEAIGCCSALRRFCMTFEHCRYEDNGGKRLYPAVLSALMEHKSTLQDVQVTEEDVCGAESEDLPTSCFSWKDFPRLEYINLPMFTLAASSNDIIVPGLQDSQRVPKLDAVLVEEILPPSLKVLKVDLRTCFNGASDSFFLNMAEAASQGYFHTLEKVDVFTAHGRRDVGSPLPLHYGQLRDIFNAVNVDFLFIIEFTGCELERLMYREWVRHYTRAGSDGIQIAGHYSYMRICKRHIQFERTHFFPEGLELIGFAQERMYMESWDWEQTIQRFPTLFL